MHSALLRYHAPSSYWCFFLHRLTNTACGYHRSRGTHLVTVSIPAPAGRTSPDPPNTLNRRLPSRPVHIIVKLNGRSYAKANSPGLTALPLLHSAHPAASHVRLSMSENLPYHAKKQNGGANARGQPRRGAGDMPVAP
jgi:hypothetical protein